MNNKIKSIFNDKIVTAKQCYAELKKHLDIDTYCTHILQQQPEYLNVYTIIRSIVYDYTLPKCKICNRTIKFKTFNLNQQPIYCCNNCKKQDYKNIQDKINNTNLIKYGVTRPIQNDQIKKSIKKTNLIKYGVENPLQNDQIKKSIKKTNLIKYGVENPLQNDQIKTKQQQTMIDKYGVKCALQNDDILKKSRNTLFRHYNTVDLNSNVFSTSKQNTCLKKYGCLHHQQNINIQNKTKRTRYNNIYDNFKLWKDYIIPLFSKEQFEGGFFNIEYNWKCVKCGNIFTQKLYTTKHNNVYDCLPRCLNCYPFVNGYSILEKELSDYIKSIYIGEIIENDKTLIHPYELDIVIPDKKVAIEFDGLYWHSDLYKQSNYHLMKTEMCEQQGYKLIHIFEDDWLNKRSIIESKIKSILGVDQISIYARKCCIKELDTVSDFLNQNHVQGEDKSSIKLGLYYGDLLVAVMTFGKSRFNKNYQYELIRYATLSGYRVIGGAGKLLKYFERTYNPNSIITYADRRYSQGNMYIKLGFMFSHNSKPNYWWIKGTQKLTRYQCQKHKLKNILGDKFNPQLSENENMYLNGWNKIYDCGNMVFVK